MGSIDKIRISVPNGGDCEVTRLQMETLLGFRGHDARGFDYEGIHHPVGLPEVIMLPYHGMFLGIEQNGDANS